MIRGTTPTHTFNVDLDLRLATIYVTYMQNGKVLFEKGNEDIVTIEEGYFLLRFSQEETLTIKACNCASSIKIQIRAIFPDGSTVVSNVMTTSVRDILRDGVIEYTGQADPDYDGADDDPEEPEPDPEPDPDPTGGD